MGWAENKAKDATNRLYLTTQIHLNEDWVREFAPLMIAGTAVWNKCIEVSKKACNDGVYPPNESELNKQLKFIPEWKINNNHVSQQVVFRYQQSVQQYRSLKKKGLRCSLPQLKPKGHLLALSWPKGSFSINEGLLILGSSRQGHKISIPMDVPQLSKDVDLRSGSVVRVEAVPKRAKRGTRGVTVNLVWDLGIVPLKAQGHVSALDINTAMMARASSSGEIQLINCRYLASILQYRNKIRAELQSKLSRCAKGSRRAKALTKCKYRKLRQLNRQIHHQLHALTAFFLAQDVVEGAAVSVIGDLRGIRNSEVRSSRARQRIHQFPFEQIRLHHRYKCLTRSIRHELIDERRTSKTCCRCGKWRPKYRETRGLWRCRECGLIIQADVNGAINILKKRLYGRLNIYWDVDFSSIDVYRWDADISQFTKVSPRA